MPRDGLCVFGVKEKMGTDSVDEYEEQSVPAVITQSGYGSRYFITIYLIIDKLGVCSCIMLLRKHADMCTSSKGMICGAIGNHTDGSRP